MTKDSAEEKIVQIGRKKMALDHALIETMDAEDDAGMDLESILKHGTAALFKDDDSKDIHYDSASVDKLLDRTQVESTDTDEDKTAESQFSFARVWANDQGALTEDVGDTNSESAPPDVSTWNKILEEREAEAEAEKAKNVETLGRGKRIRTNVDYRKGTPAPGEDLIDDDPTPQKQGRKRRTHDDSGSDIDFAGAGDTDGDDESDGGMPEEVDIRELQSYQQQGRSRSRITSQGTKGKTLVKSLPIPPKPTMSGKTSREPTIILNFSANSAKVQQGVQKSKSMTKKAVVSGKGQPRMGTAPKQPNNPATKHLIQHHTSSGKKQQAQTSGRPATPDPSNKAKAPAPAQLNASTSGETQQAQINDLPTMSNGVDQAQLLPNRHSMALAGPSTGGLASRNTLAKMLLDFSSQFPSKIQNATNEHESSQANIRQAANTTSTQKQQNPAPTSSPPQPHLSFHPNIHNNINHVRPRDSSLPVDTDTPRIPHNNSKPPRPSSVSSSSNSNNSPMVPSTPPSPCQFRKHLEKRLRTREVVEFSMKMDTDAMKAGMEMQLDMDMEAVIDMKVDLHVKSLKPRNQQPTESLRQVPSSSMPMETDRVVDMV